MAERRILEITYNDGRQVRHTITPAAEMVFERTYKVGMADAFTGAQSSTNLYRLAWELVRRATSAVMPALEEWIETVANVGVETEEIVPFVAAALTDGSPSLPSPPESPPTP